MVHIDKILIDDFVKEFYISREILDESILFECYSVYAGKPDTDFGLTDEERELTAMLMELMDDVAIKDVALRERLYLMAIMMNVPSTSVELVSHDESHYILYVLRVLSDVFNDVVNDPKTDETIEYINGLLGREKYSRESLGRLCQKVTHDFQKRLNRAKFNLLDTNEAIFRLPSTPYLPLNVKKNKIITR